MLRAMGRMSASPVSYLFIDGAYLDRLLIKAGELMFGVPFELEYMSLMGNCQKVFYYDCLPAQAGNESLEDFNARYAHKEAFFDHLRSLNGWHVAEGSSRWRRGKGAGQKEVDILIAVDMLSHTFRRNMDQLIFIAGDLDFRPLIEAVVNDGMYVNLWFGPQSTSPLLRNAADSQEALDVYRLHSFCTEDFKKRHPLPVRSSYWNVSLGKVIEIGRVDGREVAWVETLPIGGHALWAAGAGKQPMTRYGEASIDEMKRVHKLLHSDVTWDTVKA